LDYLEATISKAEFSEKYIPIQITEKDIQDQHARIHKILPDSCAGLGVNSAGPRGAKIRPYGQTAGDERKQFLQAVTFDEKWMRQFKGYHVGMSGVYIISMKKAK
jgi:hypothetical protein